MIPCYVLDACAVIAFFNDEVGSDAVEDLLDKAVAGHVTLSMGKVNLTEVYYGLLREYGSAKADAFIDEIESMPIQIINDISDDLMQKASHIKVSYKASLADSFAVGLSILLGGSLVTADHHELDAVEKGEAVEFTWIR